jgi:FtsZ-interacting cell division protein YlmF
MQISTVIEQENKLQQIDYSLAKNALIVQLKVTFKMKSILFLKVDTLEQVRWRERERDRKKEREKEREKEKERERKRKRERKRLEKNENKMALTCSSKRATSCDTLTCRLP